MANTRHTFFGYLVVLEKRSCAGDCGNEICKKQCKVLRESTVGKQCVRKRFDISLWKSTVKKTETIMNRATSILAGRSNGMKDFVKQQSVGEIVRNAKTIFLRHFWLFCRIYSLPLLPSAILVRYAQSVDDMSSLYYVSAGFYLLITLLALPAITIAMSHICLGSEPRFSTAYGRMFIRIGGYIVTYIQLVMVGLLLTAMVFVIIYYFSPPGPLPVAFRIFIMGAFFVYVMGFMFALPVAALEPIFGAKALKRSMVLGKDYYLRNFTAFVVLLAVVSLLVIVLAILVSQLGIDPNSPVLMGVIVTFAVFLVPLCLIGLVLLYWDMRVRKEGYDSSVLAEELRD